MKLKTLLLGSAAAMIAVTGARAADAVVAEPEPVEYVRVCDMYGAGYFYIPGGETCLKISGLVRSTYSYTSGTGGAASTAAWGYRGRLNFDAANESDLGTVSSRLRIQGDGNGGADANAGLDWATISLGGLRLGYSDQYFVTNVGYGAPGPINDASQYDQSIALQYTFSGNGFAATVGVQDELGTSAGAKNLDVYGGINYSGSGFGFAATVGYDGTANTSAGNVMLSVTAIEGLTIKGIYTSKFDNNKANHFINGTGVNNHYVVGLNYQATDALNVYAAYSDTNVANSSATTVGANYNIAAGLRVQGEVTFNENNSTQYQLRVQRSF